MKYAGAATAKQAIAAVDAIVGVDTDEPEWRAQRQAAALAHQVDAKLVVFEEPGASDPEHAYVMLITMTEDQVLVRVPLFRRDMKALLELTGRVAFR